MNTYHKLYLSLSLLISGNIISQENILPHSYIESNEDAEDTIQLSLEEEIDQDLYELFNLFFDDHDKTPFSKIVSEVINLLKRKKSTLQDTDISKCDEIIKLLEKNKTNYSFPAWAKILINPDLLTLMSEKTRSYINSVSMQIKITSLIQKLRNLY